MSFEKVLKFFKKHKTESKLTTSYRRKAKQKSFQKVFKKI